MWREANLWRGAILSPIPGEGGLQPIVCCQPARSSTGCFLAVSPGCFLAVSPGLLLTVSSGGFWLVLPGFVFLTFVSVSWPKTGPV